jgi:hypothetical protein
MGRVAAGIGALEGNAPVALSLSDAQDVAAPLHVASSPRFSESQGGHPDLHQDVGVSVETPLTEIPICIILWAS